MSALGHARRSIDTVTTKLIAFLFAAYLTYDTTVSRVYGMAAELVAMMFPSLEPEARAVGRAAQTETVIAGVVIGAALLIGFFVVAQIDSALPAITDNDLSTDKNDTLDRIGDGLLIGGVVIIVLFAAIILRVLRGL